MTHPETQHQQQYAVLSVGEALVDFIAHTSPDLESAGQFSRAAGGAPANVAVAAAKLGAGTAFVGAVGSDPFGRYLRRVLDMHGVDTDALVTIAPERGRTTLAFVAKNTGGIPAFIFYRSADALLEASDVPEALVQRSTFVHLSSMALVTEPAASATRRAVELARQCGSLVSFDPNVRVSSWKSIDDARHLILELAGHASVLKINDEEARLLTGKKEPAEGLCALSRRFPGALCIVTTGASGCLWQRSDQSGAVRSPRVEVVDTTGAGDAFVGALLAELDSRGARSGLDTLTETDITRSVGFACAAAAASCTMPGAMASLPDRGEVESLVQTLETAR
jgi:fructokinase